jgi:hypothetical protein
MLLHKVFQDERLEVLNVLFEPPNDLDSIDLRHQTLDPLLVVLLNGVNGGFKMIFAAN